MIPHNKRWIAIIIPVVLSFLFFGSMLLELLNTFGGNYSGFIHLRQFGIERNPFLRQNPELRRTILIFNQGGHDTKFYYAVAFDPFLTAFPNKLEVYSKMVDSPRVRFSRIGYPLLVNLFSAGAAERFPKTMVWLVLLSHCIAIFFLAKILMIYDCKAYWALLYLLIPGLTVSCVRVLPESISGAFLLAGLFFYLKDKLFLCAFLLSSAILIRESNAIAVILISGWEVLSKRRVSGLVVLCSFIPYIGWKIFLTYRLFPMFQWTTLFYSPQVLGFPFRGIWTLFHHISADQYPAGKIAAAIFYAILISSMFLLSIYILTKRRSLITIIFFCYSLLAVSLDYEKIWAGLGNAERTTFESFIFLIITCCHVQENSRIPWKVALLVFFAITLVYDFFFLTSSESFKTGLLLSALF